MRAKPFLWIIIIFFYFGCNGCDSKKERQVDSKIILPYRMVDQVSDSTFFGFIGDIVADDSVILFLDHAQKKLFLCDHHLNLINTIGRSGKGPGELLYPSEVSIYDGCYLVRDNNKIKKYSHDGLFIGSIDTKTNLTASFTMDKAENYYLYSGTYSSLPILVIDKNNKEVNSIGVKYEVPGNERQKFWFQSRSLYISDDDQIVSVGTSYPSVEIYDLNGKVILAQELDEPIIVESYEKIVEDLAEEPNGIGHLYADSYVFKNHLFILKTTRINEKMFNYIFVWAITDGKIIPTRRYELKMIDEKEHFFDKMCLLNDTTLLVSEMKSMTLCLFRL